MITIAWQDYQLSKSEPSMVTLGTLVFSVDQNRSHISERKNACGVYMVKKPKISEFMKMMVGDEGISL